MRPFPLVTLLRLSLLVAIAASAALLVEYQNVGDPAFCGAGSGCFAVRVSPYSQVLGVPLPVIGLLAHAALLCGSLAARTREHLMALALTASAGGAFAFLFLGLQEFVIGALCPWCVAVDVASIVAATCAVLLAARAKSAGPAPASEPGAAAGPGARSPSTGTAPAGPFWRAVLPTGIETLAWSVAATLAIGLPFLWGRYPVLPPMPPAIAAMQIQGKVTIVGFTDFQCPFCRKLHPAIQDIEHRYGDRIHYSRYMMPLPGHPGAMPAAQAYLCSPEDKREAAADWLYQADDDALTPSGVLALATALGLDRAAFERCLDAPETRAALARDKGIYETLGARGLPLTYIGPRVVVGFDPERVERAVQLELAGERQSLPLAWLFVALGAAFLGATLVAWRGKAAGDPTRAA